MRRRGYILALVLACAAGVCGRSAAQTETLWPAVTLERGVQLTPNGPVAINILRGPRPGGATTLQPVVSNDSLVGRETLTAITKRLSATVTAAGVNGDYFNFETGRPSGIVMHEGQLLAAPNADRASAGILTDGTLDIRRATFFGTWQGASQRRTLNVFNEVPPDDGIALFTSAYGLSTPAIAGAFAVVFFPFPAPVPNAELEATVVEAGPAQGTVPIPFGGAVLVARGRASAALAAEAPLGQLVRTRLILQPEWQGVVAAVGGGPQIVREGAPIFRAGEAFTSEQLRPRTARSAIGQLRDGRVILVAVDGRQPGYSVGLTNFELAQTLVRLGAVTGMALDGGGSTTMAVDGALVNRPADGGERPISTALLFLYDGIYAPPPVPVISPNGDGIDDDPLLTFKVVRPATATVTLTAPDGTAAFTQTAEVKPGTFPVSFPPAGFEAGTAASVSGKWKLKVEAVDDLGATSAMIRRFKANATLGFLAAAPPKAFVPPGGRSIVIGWRLERRSRVVVTIVDRDGRVVRTLALRRYEAGDRSVEWDGLGRGKSVLKGGVYRAVVRATNNLGRTELATAIPLRNIAKRPAGA